MPVLNVIIHSFPETLAAGQLVDAFIVITNTGCRDLTNLQVVLSHPQLIHFGSATSSNGVAQSGVLSGVPNNLVDGTLQKLELKDSVLKAGDSVQIPIRVRCEKLGNHHVKFIFGYVGVVSVF